MKVAELSPTVIQKLREDICRAQQLLSEIEKGVSQMEEVNRAYVSILNRLDQPKSPKSDARNDHNKYGMK